MLAIYLRRRVAGKEKALGARNNFHILSVAAIYFAKKLKEIVEG